MIGLIACHLMMAKVIHGETMAQINAHIHTDGASTSRQYIKRCMRK